MKYRLGAVLGVLGLAPPAFAQPSAAAEPSAAAGSMSDSAATSAAPAATASAPSAAEPAPEAPSAAPAPAEQPPSPPPATTLSPPPAPQQLSPVLLPPQRPKGAEAEASVVTPRPRGPHDLSLQLGLGINGRFGDASGYARDSGLGPSYALGLWFGASPALALGLELSHARLGHASADNGVNLLDADFSSSAAWLAGRLFPFRTSDFALYLGLRVGLAVEHVAATGTAQDGAAGLLRASVFECSGTRGPALGLGGGVGSVLSLSSRLELISELGVHAEQLTSERVGDCANGVGSTTSLGFGFALGYGFELAGGGSAQARTPARAAHTW